MLEVQRHGNILPMNLFHMTSRDMRVGGHFIPSGTTVIPQISAVHADEKYFRNAHVFEPQRFLDEPKLVEKVRCLGQSINQ